MGLEFDKCCCCIDLRLGCLIIGYVNLIQDIVAIVVFSVIASVIGLMSEDQDPELNAVLISVVAVTFIVCLLSLVFTIVLLVGLHQNKRGHIKAYLIYTLIFVIPFPIMIFASLALYSGFNPGLIVNNVITIVVNIYLLLVIRSYYIKIDDPSDGAAIFNKP